MSITNFTTFGRQSTNPQWQDPSLLDPKVNFTWIKGKHSLKFGYEYEHIWMAVNDNNPLYGSWTYGGGYSTCPAGTVIPALAPVPLRRNAHQSLDPRLLTVLGRFHVRPHQQLSAGQLLRRPPPPVLDSRYVQDDWKVLPNLTLNVGLRWEYGSPYSEQHNYISNFDPVNQVVDTISPGAVAGNGIKPVTGSGARQDPRQSAVA